MLNMFLEINLCNIDDGDDANNDEVVDIDTISFTDNTTTNNKNNNNNNNDTNDNSSNNNRNNKIKVHIDSNLRFMVTI